MITYNNDVKLYTGTCLEASIRYLSLIADEWCLCLRWKPRLSEIENEVKCE